jgi:ribonuclease VapC
LIVVDASALIAVQFKEPEALSFAKLLVAQDRIMIGTPTAFEYFMVVAGRKREEGLAQARRLLLGFQIELVSFTPDLLELAASAFLRFGKGRHPAALNYGDCMAYALARSLDALLLFKGTDFGRTDVKVASA